MYACADYTLRVVHFQKLSKIKLRSIFVLICILSIEKHCLFLLLFIFLFFVRFFCFCCFFVKFFLTSLMVRPWLCELCTKQFSFTLLHNRTRWYYFQLILIAIFKMPLLLHIHTHIYETIQI